MATRMIPPSPLLGNKENNLKLPDVPGKFQTEMCISAKQVTPHRDQKEHCKLQLHSDVLQLGSKRSDNVKSTNELYEVLKAKLHSGYYHAMCHSFKSFDPQGNGSVTKDALYRLLCNFLPGLGSAQFNLLLSRLNLQKKVISFEEFCSKFNVVNDKKNHWLDPVTRHASSQLLPPMTWRHVHEELIARTKKSLSAFLCYKPQILTKSEFQNFLVSLSLMPREDQFVCLWNRYVPEGSSYLSLQSLLHQLGVDVTSIPQSGEKKKAFVPSLSLDDVKEQLLNHLELADTLQSGRVSIAQLRMVLCKAGVLLSEGQLRDLLERLGFQTNKMIFYRDFVNLFANRNKGSITHTVLTNQNNRFYQKQLHRSCSSAQDAENSIVTLLQSKFLALLAAFKEHDPKNTGYIRKDDFKLCVQRLLACSTSTRSLDHLISILCHDSSSQCMVPYPKFLAMFDAKGPVRPLSSRPLVWYPPTKDLMLPSRVQRHTEPEIVNQISHLVTRDTALLTRHFNKMDELNTGRLTLPQTLELLLQCGISIAKDQFQPLWEKLLKNRDGTVSFQQFLKEFHNYFNEAGCLEKRWTEDHCFMRSKTLHRDEDMLLNALSSKLAYYQQNLIEHFRSLDENSSGLITVLNFQRVLRKLCPSLTDPELDMLANKYQKGSSGYVEYEKMLAFFKPTVNPYRTGYGLGRLLAQQERDVVMETAAPHSLATKPNHGLPGVKGFLQKQVTKKWKEVRRMFKSVDSTGTGNISVKMFKKVLNHCQLKLDNEQLYHLLETLDPQLSGQINYHVFLNVILE